MSSSVLVSGKALLLEYDFSKYLGVYIASYYIVLVRTHIRYHKNWISTFIFIL